jgi:hypothetical protein
MKPVILLIVGLFLTSCATKEDAELNPTGPSLKEQKKEAKQQEEFAKQLPPPR